MAFKDKMKQRRSELDLTLEDVAKIVGVGRQTIQKYESGIVANIPSDKIERIAVALKTTPAYLMGWVEEQSTNVPDDELFNGLVKVFRSLPDSARGQVLDYMRFLANKEKEQ